MRRLNTLLTTIIFLLNFLFVNASAVEIESETQENNKLISQQSALIALGIMRENSEGVIKDDKQITRAEFADTLAGLINVNTTDAATTSYFYDVAVDAWYTNAINALTEYHVISQSENKMFYPDKVITLDEAVKMVVCILGYRMQAEQLGKYPGNYRSMASSLGLYDGMPQGSQLTNAHMTVLLYNALDVDTTEMDISGPSINISAGSRKLLEKTKNIYKASGIIESIYGMSLYGGNITERSEAIIGGTRYEFDDYIGLRNNFGRKVEFFYKDNGHDEPFELIYMEPYYSDDVLTVLSDDFIEYDSGMSIIKYDYGKRTLKAKLSNDMIVMQNGIVVDTNVSEVLKVKNGVLKLIDKDDDGNYDICLAEEFQTGIVNIVNAEKQIITYKNISDNVKNDNIQFTEGFTSLTVYSSVGTVADFSAITPGTVIDIAVSRDNSAAEIYTNADTIEGFIESISYDERKITVNGTQYDYYSHITDYCPLNPGDYGVLKLNRYGKIVFFEEKTNKDLIIPVAYLIKAYRCSDDEEYCMIKYLDASGEILKKRVSNKVIIDGEKPSIKRVCALLSDAEGTVIALSVNGEDEVKKIDTVTQGIDEDENAIVKTLEDNQSNQNGNRWTSSNKTFGKKTVLSENPIVFVVPPSGTDYEDFADDDNSYRIGTLQDMLTNLDYHTECYRLGKSVYSNVVVLHQYKYQTSSRNRFIMVDNVYESVDENGDIVATIVGYQGLEKVSFNFSCEQYSVGTTDDCDIVLHRGDIITVGAKDKYGLIGTVEVHFDVNRNWSGINQICLGGYMFDRPSYKNYDAMYYWVNFNDLQSYTRFIAGCPMEIDDNVMKFKYPPASSADHQGLYAWRQWNLPTDESDYDEIAILKDTTPVIVYDSESDRVSIGTVADIMTSDAYSCPSQVLIDKYWGEVVSIYVINNNHEAWTRPDEMRE